MRNRFSTVRSIVYSKNGVVLVVYVTFFGILAWVFNATTLPLIASIATILSVILVPLLYFLNIADERRRISRNLYGELTDTLDTLELRHGKEAEFVYEVNVRDKEDKETYLFTNRFFNHDVYDSLVRSGKINFLKYELQQQVQNIFTMIKQHNRYLQTTLDNSVRFGAGKTLVPYYKIMDEYEQDLLKQIPIMLEKLKMEFPHIT